jgi:flagellar basal body-associated protein FliL
LPSRPGGKAPGTDRNPDERNCMSILWIILIILLVLLLLGGFGYSRR